MEAYNLSLASIDKIIEELDNYISNKRVSRREKIHFKLIAEEVLLKYHDKFGDDVKVEYQIVEILSRISIRFTIYSDKFDPFDVDKNDGVMKSLLTTLESRNPIWKFVDSKSLWVFSTDNKNEIEFFIPKIARVSGPLKIVISLILGLLASIPCKLFLTPDTCKLISDNFLLPITNAYTGLLSVMAILMIFFSIPLCMVQYGNTTAFHKITKRLILSFLLPTIVLVILSTIFGISMFGVGNETITGTSVLKPLLDVFISFIPTNILAPFVNFNCMQVMIIGLLFGFAFNIMDKQAKELVTIFDKGNFVAVVTNSFLSKFVYIYVGVMTFYFILSDYSAGLGDLYWFIGAILGFGALIMIVFSTIVCIKTGVKPIVLLRKLMPSFIINLSSASIAASFIDLFDELAKKCGVNIGYNGVAVNLGVVLFKPLFAVFLVLSGFVAASMSGGITYGVIIEIIIISIFLPATIPNIQGGATSVIILMVSQLGFGSKGTEILIPLSILLQFIIVPINVFSLQCVIILRAAKENKINLETLKKA